MRNVMEAHHATSKRLSVFLVFALALYVWGGLPPQLWFNVSSVHVDNANFGTAPKMAVERVIARNFTGSWRVELERKVNGGFELTDSALSNGQFEYDSDNVLPENLDFDWWTWPKKLRPEPGLYRIETCWTLHFVLIADRHLCIKSNVFEVKQMSAIGSKLRSLEGGRIGFMCPGCKEMHQVTIDGSRGWAFNGDGDKPTISPSILVTWSEPSVVESEFDDTTKDTKHVCHSFVTDGNIQFLSDCSHELAGHTLLLPDWEP